jgi:hypothetical protein
MPARAAATTCRGAVTLLSLLVFWRTCVCPPTSLHWPGNCSLAALRELRWHVTCAVTTSTLDLQPSQVPGWVLEPSSPPKVATALPKICRIFAPRIRFGQAVQRAHRGKTWFIKLPTGRKPGYGEELAIGNITIRHGAEIPQKRSIKVPRGFIPCIDVQFMVTIASRPGTASTPQLV